ncbi:unnamed protein product, partial [marine sediment metagenome]
WEFVAAKTNIEKLSLTTRDISDYDVLMKQRLEILRDNNISLYDIQKILKKLQNQRRYGRVYNGELNNIKVSVIRSQIGAPNCAIAVECLKRCKTKIIVRLDICGGIINRASEINIGDVLIPQLAYCDDGTSPQYIREHPSLANDLEAISNPLSTDLIS